MYAGGAAFPPGTSLLLGVLRGQRGLPHRPGEGDASRSGGALCPWTETRERDLGDARKAGETLAWGAVAAAWVWGASGSRADAASRGRGAETTSRRDARGVGFPGGSARGAGSGRGHGAYPSPPRPAPPAGTSHGGPMRRAQPRRAACEPVGRGPACYSPSGPVLALEDPGTFFQVFSGRHGTAALTEADVTDVRAKAGEDPLCSPRSGTFPRVSEVEMRGSEDAAPGTVLQRLIQEQLRYGPSTETMSLLALQQQATGSAGPARPPGFPSTENLAPEDPPMVHQSARQEPQGQEHQVDGAAMEKQARPVPPPGEDLPTYEEAKAQSQLFRPPQGYYRVGGGQPARSEGRPSVSRAHSGQALKDEALRELKQGHVRSLSERIMQLSLERGGPSKAPPAPPAGKDPRGPPPEYPFKSKPAMAAVGKPQELGLLYPEHAGMLPELLKPYPAPQPVRTEVAVLRYQPPPEYGVTSRPCQLPFPATVPPHSPVPSQASVVSGPLHSVSLPLPLPVALAALPPPLPAASPGPQLGPDALAIVERAQQMVEILTKENRALQQELQAHCDSSEKLHKFEKELQRISEAYESLVRSSSKRESLDKAMRDKLEGEIRRLHDFNRDLRDRLETANRQLSGLGHDGLQERAAEGLYASQNREFLKEKEKLEMELAAVRTASEDHRRHIEILEQALSNAQGRVIKLEEELREKQAYVEKVENLQQALYQLQAACEKREQMEQRLRTWLERELDALRAQQKHGAGQRSGGPEPNAPALLELLREKEERILALEADKTRWEQKYLEESTIRHFAMNAAASAAAERDTTLIRHSRAGSYGEGSLEAHGWQEEEEAVQAARRCQDMEFTIKNLHAKIIEKDAMIKVLQQRARKEASKPDSASLRPARSVPSIAAATGSHSRQTSLTSSQPAEEKREEKPWKGSIGLLLGKETQDPACSPPLPAPTTSIMPASSAHAKTGSRDSGTQTDRGSELFWPHAASLPSRGRLSATPAHSPVLKHPTAKENCPSHGKSPEHKGRAGCLLHKAELPDAEMMEVLI